MFEHLKEEGKLFDAEGQWRPELTPEALDVPEGVRLVLGRRLERLEATTPKVLGAAAVVGRRFSLDLVRALSGLGPDAFLESIAA